MTLGRAPQHAVLVLAAVGAALVALLATTFVAALGSSATYSSAAQPVALGAPPGAVADIPPSYLALYRAAAARYGLDWSVLAAVGKVECDHGRDPDPSCTRPGSVNAAGAGGPMQFLAATWATYAVDADGDGIRSRWDPADAIFGAARYLRAAGAPRDYERALLAYNDAGWYVSEVLAVARRYRATTASREESAPSEGTLARMQTQTGTQIRLIEGDSARLAPGDGHLALIPAGVPAAVAAMLVAGNELQTLPYGPGGHPNPLGAVEEDCSSTVNYVLYRAGIRPLGEIERDNPLAQDYVHWGAPGPGRWVTIYATSAPIPHVFVTIAGLRLDTSHNGTDVGPNRAQDGPRWRLLDRIPTWGHWSVRHPPGL